MDREHPGYVPESELSTHQDNSLETDRDLHFLEGLINELEDGELVSETDLLRATDLGIDSVKAAKQALKELREYRDPVITVPQRYWESVREAGQMDAHTTWDNTQAIRGRINSAYVGHEDEPRLVYKVLPHVQLHPRFTTTSKSKTPKFYGVFEVDANSIPLVIGRDIVEVGEI
ncbi:MAG TPA: hypothetical protein PKD79_03895 [Candidatus Doudnabacteria bacterium]|nr:hypothetical protein [Candidatus Doudnabacteria bacterium]